MKIKTLAGGIVFLMWAILIDGASGTQDDQRPPTPSGSVPPERPGDKTEFLQLPDYSGAVPGAKVETRDAEGNLINITLNDVELSDVVRMFTRISGANIVASPTNLTGRVTVNLEDVEWKSALKSILDMHSLTLVETLPESGVYSVVQRPHDAPEPMIVKTIFLKYTTVAEVVPVVKTMLVENAKLSEFPSRNAIVVKSTAANLGEVAQLVREIDLTSKQVCIETVFMELSDEASKALGIKWDVLKEFSVGFEAGPYEETMDVKETRSREYAVKKWDYDGQKSDRWTYYETEPLEEDGKDVDSAIKDTYLKTIEKAEAMVLEFDDLDIVLSALENTDGVSIISNPKMIVANGSTNAFFSVGSREPIIKKEVTRGTEESPGDKTTAMLDTDINTDYIKEGYLETGIMLRVIPIVKTDDLIEADITPSLRRKTGTKIVDDNSWPIISVKEIRTRFTLRSGQTVAIGGLTDTEDDVEVNKIPLLGDIPLIGKYLFSHTSDTKKQIETIIFVTLTLAPPKSMRSDHGIPVNAELVHKRMIQSEARRKQFLADLKKMKEAAAAKAAEKNDTVSPYATD